MKANNNDRNETENKANAEAVVEQVQEKAGDVAGQAKEQALDVARIAGQEARGSVANQKQFAAGELHNVAEALRETEVQLRNKDQDLIAEYSGRMAEQIDRASGYLQERDLDELIADVQDVARRQPELFLGGAFTLGLLAARFLKSSTPDNRNELPNKYRYDMPFPRPAAGEYYGRTRVKRNATPDLDRS